MDSGISDDINLSFGSCRSLNDQKFFQGSIQEPKLTSLNCSYRGLLSCFSYPGKVGDANLMLGLPCCLKCRMPRTWELET